MWAREADGAFRGGNQQSGPTTSDMPEPFTDPSGDGMEWLCKPAASEDNVCGWFTVCQPKHLGVLHFADSPCREDADSEDRSFNLVRATVWTFTSFKGETCRQPGEN